MRNENGKTLCIKQQCYTPLDINANDINDNKNWHEIIWHVNGYWVLMGYSKSKVKSLYLPKAASHMNISEAKEENIDH